MPRLTFRRRDRERERPARHVAIPRHRAPGHRVGPRRHLPLHRGHDLAESALASGASATATLAGPVTVIVVTLSSGVWEKDRRIESGAAATVALAAGDDCAKMGMKRRSPGGRGHEANGEGHGSGGAGRAMSARQRH